MPLNEFFNALDSVRTGLPSLLIFICFVISAVKLRGSDSAEAQDRNRKATTTIMIFTFIFLLCNFPFFATITFFTIERSFGQDYPGYFFGSSAFMSLHSWVLAKVGFVVLNATLNPVMYFLRMQNLRNWVRRRDMQSFMSESFRRASTTSLGHALSSLSASTFKEREENSGVMVLNPTVVEETTFTSTYSEGI